MALEPEPAPADEVRATAVVVPAPAIPDLAPGLLEAIPAFDPVSIQMGVDVVNKTLSDSYVSPDEATKAQAKLKDKGRHTFIDKVSVRLVASDDKYWATLANFGDKYVHISDRYIRDYDRLLQGGVWAQRRRVRAGPRAGRS